MIDTEPIRNLIVESIVTGVCTKNSLNYVILKEDDSSARLRRVDLYGVSPDSLLINLDKVTPPNTLFKSTDGLCKRCDYVLITEHSGRESLIFIEIKSGKPKRKEVCNQFHGGECLVDYIDSTLCRFYQRNSYFGKLARKFVVFYKPPSIRKRTTRFKMQCTKNDTPEKFCVYPNPINPHIKTIIG